MFGPIETSDGSEYRAYVSGLAETHDGIEVEFRSKLPPSLEIDGLISIGDWRWDNDVDTDIKDDQTGDVIETLHIYSSGLMVSDAPQTQLGIQARIDLPNNFRAGSSYVYNTRLFAQFQIDLDRDDEERIGIQAVELSSFGYLDCNLNWFTRKDALDISLGLNIQNALNNIYINEADETWARPQY
tara:strand:- start:477 stop:1031 length:555 start_codon:yes stop_codon:yes gene_type:complete